MNAWDALGATVLHVTPTDDLVDHDTSGEQGCVCGPRYDLYRTEFGDRWLAVHSSLDGRERDEVAA